jgi:hypothetical protein
MCALRTVQYQASSSSNLMLESPCWNPAGVATRSKRLWRVQFDDLGRASIHLTSQRPKRRHEPCALRAPRDWESIKFLTSWPICKLLASQSRTDFNLRPTISATSKDLASISSIPGPATNEASWATTCFCSRHTTAVSNFGRAVAMEGLHRPGNKSARGCPERTPCTWYRWLDSNHRPS